MSRKNTDHEKTRNQAVWTSLYRINCAYPACTQRPHLASCEGFVFDNDKFDTQELYFEKHLYEKIEHIESHTRDPLTGKNLECPFFMVLDSPAATDSVGGSPPIAEYNSIFTTGVSRTALRDPRNACMYRILSINCDKQLGTKELQQNLDSIKRKGILVTDDDRKKAASRNKNSKRNRWIGPCILCIMILFHLTLKQPERFLIYLSVLSGGQNAENTIQAIVKFLQLLLKTRIVMLILNRYGGKPQAATRGEVVDALCEKGTFKKVIDELIDRTQFGPNTNRALDMMGETCEINHLLFNERADLTDSQIDLRAELLEHFSIIHNMLGRALFEDAYVTPSLRTLSDIAPYWMKLCHKIGQGWNHCSESMIEHSHQDSDRDLKCAPLLCDAENRCEVTRHVVKRNDYVKWNYVTMMVQDHKEQFAKQMKL